MAKEEFTPKLTAPPGSGPASEILLRIVLATLSCAVLIFAPVTGGPAERTATYPGSLGREIAPFVLFETVFPLDELLPVHWTSAQRKEVAYLVERMKKDNRIFLLVQATLDPIGRDGDNEQLARELSHAAAERLRESGVPPDRMLIVPGTEDAGLFDEPRWDGFAKRQRVTVMGLRGGPWLARRDAPLDVREALPPEGSIRILSPSEGRTDRARHLLRGTAGAGVTSISIVIGQETQTAAVYGGKFEVPISLRPGENRIVVTGLDPFGRALRAALGILYVPPKPTIELASPPRDAVVDISRSPVIAVNGAIRSRNPLKGAYLIQNDMPLPIRVRPDGSFAQTAAMVTDEDAFQVEAEDAEGRTGVSEVRKVTARGIAERPLMAILHWDEDDVDLDLHVTDAGGRHTYWEAPDILENAAAIPAGKLLLDNREGFGPEVFTIEKNIPGTYTFSAEYYRGRKACQAYLTIVLFAGSPSRKLVRSFGPIGINPSRRTVLLVQVSLPPGTILDLAE